MKKVCVFILSVFATTVTLMAQTSPFHSFKMASIDGETIDFSKYKGRKVLVVNTASECGFTPQYEDLQLLHEQLGEKVAVLGFPANNFGGQESGSNMQIAQFCKKNYGVTFQLFEKIDVVGDSQHPLYTWLQKESGEAPTWNFCKYLIDENGKVVKFFPSAVKPMDEQVTKLL